ncbi:MAG TPA: hypothetical protein VGN08_08505 [Solirubrobacteraceae bacterium]|jgi:hypothetical protein
MSLAVAVAVIVIADVALLGLVAFVMSRARLLEPHGSSPTASAATPAPREARVPARRPARRRDYVPV